MTSTILCVGALTMDTILRLDELPNAAGKYLPREAVEIDPRVGDRVPSTKGTL